MAFQRKQISAENALMRLETLCSRSEHCEWELREKLRGWQVAAADAERILEALAKNRFYDDCRFARAYVRNQLMYNCWGRRKIALGLRVKHISRDMADDALEEIDADEYEEILRGFLRAKARGIKEGNTYEGRSKLYRAGISRGFESQLVAGIIRSESLWDD